MVHTLSIFCLFCLILMKSTYVVVAQQALPIFHIVLENDQTKETLTLRYKLLHHSVAGKFVKLIKKILTSSRSQLKYVSWAVYPTGDHVVKEQLSKLYEHIKFFNEQNGLGLHFQYAVIPRENISLSDLNLLHSQFEANIIKTNSVLTGSHNKLESKLSNAPVILREGIEKALNSINSLIHSIEHLLSRAKNSYNSYFSAYLASEPYVPDLNLASNESNLFNLSSKFGDLLLGYGTTGKSLYHIYKDKDLELIKKGGRPSPQRFVTPNILACFFQTISHDKDYNAMIEWLKENKVGEKLGINIYDVQNNPGYIKLGELIWESRWGQITENELMSKLSPYSTVVSYYFRAE